MYALLYGKQWINLPAGCPRPLKNLFSVCTATFLARFLFGDHCTKSKISKQTDVREVD